MTPTTQHSGKGKIVEQVKSDFQGLDGREVQKKEYRIVTILCGSIIMGKFPLCVCSSSPILRVNNIKNEP